MFNDLQPILSSEPVFLFQAGQTELVFSQRRLEQQNFAPFYYFAVQRVELFLPPDQASIVQAFLYNYWQDFDPVFRYQTGVLGIFHLFSISGLHFFQIMLLCLLFFSLITSLFPRLFYLGWSFELIRFGSLLVGFGYAYLLNFPLPATRSLLFFALWFLCDRFLPFYPKKIRLSLLLLCFLLTMPNSIGSLSLILSFLSVLGIYLALDFLTIFNLNRIKQNPVLFYLLSTFLISLAIHLVAFPIFWAYFGVWNPFQAFNNLLHIFIASWVLLPLAFLTLIWALLLYGTAPWLAPLASLLGWFEAWTYRALALCLEAWQKLISANFDWVEDFSVQGIAFKGFYWLWGGFILALFLLFEHLALAKKRRPLP